MPYRAPVRRLLISYGSAMFIIVGLAIAAQCLIQISLAQEVNARHTATVVGRQQGRSLRLMTDTMFLAIPQNHSSVEQQERVNVLKEMHSLEPQWEEVEQGVQQGDSTFAIPADLPIDVKQHAQGVNKDFVLMRDIFLAVLQKQSATPLQAELVEEYERLYIGAGTSLANEQGYTYIFDTLTQRADAYVTAVQILELILFGLTLTTLACEAIFVVRPAIQDLKHAYIELAERGAQKATTTTLSAAQQSTQQTKRSSGG